jgi:hypothetical protein
MSNSPSRVDRVRALQQQRASRTEELREQQNRLDHLQATIYKTELCVCDFLRGANQADATSSPFSPSASLAEIPGQLRDTAEALRAASRDTKRCNIDRDSTFDSYPKTGGTDRALAREAFDHALEMIDSSFGEETANGPLESLVTAAVEVDGLRGAWEWVIILIKGIAGLQRLEWLGQALAIVQTDPAGAKVPEGTAAPGDPGGGGHAEGDTGAGAGADELGDRAKELLVAYLRLGAESKRRRKPRIQAAQEADPNCSPSTYNHANATLGRKGYLQAATPGEGGGCWLTPAGKALAESLSRPQPKQN